MPNLAVLSVVASGGGRYLPSTPTFSYTGTGTFSITNYDPNLIYNITVNTGSATRTGSTVTLNDASMEATITASPPKGGVYSGSVILGRSPYYYVQQCSTCASGSYDEPGFWILQPYTCCSTVLGSPPANYVNGSNEFRRIT